MTASTLKLIRWDWFKLQRRWMPWILLGFLLLFSQLSVWGSLISYTRLQSSGGSVSLPAVTDAPGRGGQFRAVSCNDLVADPSAVVPDAMPPEVITGLQAQCRQQAEQLQGQLWRQYDQFTLPGSFPRSFGIIQGVGLILLAVLTASSVGSDHGLGTLRPILVRGTGRLSYLAGKFLLLIVVAAGALLVVAIFTAISSLIAAGVAEAPPGVPETSSWATAGAALGKTWYSFIPYIAFAGTLTILTRSTAAGMGIGLGYFFAEGILIALLTALFEQFESVANYLLLRNINAFAGGSFSFAPGAGNSEAGLVQAGIVLAFYIAVLAGISIRIFQRRDVAGASGG